MKLDKYEEATSAEEERLMQEAWARREEAMGKLLRVVLEQRDHAIKQRAASGIEDMWLEAEEAYEGIDDYNRGDRRCRVRKPYTTNGASVPVIPRGNRATLVLNITGQYVDAASARIADMLMPGDGPPFSFRPTPIPEIEDSIQKIGEAPQEQAEFLKRYQNEASRRARAAQRRIEDYLAECQFNGEGRKVIDDLCRLGTGVMKGPVPVVRKATKYQTKDDGFGGVAQEVVTIEKIVPASMRISPWDIYPDPDCGDCIHDGQFILERSRMTGKTLRELKDTPGFDAFADQIMLALKEGPSRKEGETHTMDLALRPGNDRDQYEVWHYYGCLDRSQLESSGCNCEGYSDDYMHVVVTVVNDRIIRATPNPLQSGEFPYDLLPWRKLEQSPWGIGIASQINEPQRMLTAAARNMMDNAGISGGPQIVVDSSKIVPADGKWELTGRKLWTLKPDAIVAGDFDIRRAFQSVTIETRQEELANILQLALKMAEDVTGLPMLLQGQQGKAPDTVGGMTILNNNANSVLRRFAKQFDDYLTEPHMRRYYEWLMRYGEDDSEKGDFQINAIGSSTMIERDNQYQFLVQMGQMVLQPQFKVNPEKYIQTIFESMRLDPSSLQYTDEEWREIQEKQSGAPPDPSIAVAQIRTQSDQQIAQMRAQMEQQAQQTELQMKQMQMEMQAQMEQQRMQYEAQQAEANRQLELFIAQMKEGFNQKKLEADQVISVAEMKTAMEMSAQKESNANQRFNTEVAIKQIQGSGI